MRLNQADSKLQSVVIGQNGHGARCGQLSSGSHELCFQGEEIDLDTLFVLEDEIQKTRQHLEEVERVEVMGTGLHQCWHFDVEKILCGTIKIRLSQILFQNRRFRLNAFSRSAISWSRPRQ